MKKPIPQDQPAATEFSGTSAEHRTPASGPWRWLVNAIRRRQRLEGLNEALLKKALDHQRYVDWLDADRKNTLAKLEASRAALSASQARLVQSNSIARSPVFLARQLWRVGKFALLMKLRRGKYRRIMADTGLFDSRWYLMKYPDAAQFGDPAMHFLLQGAFEGRSPSAYFDTDFYLDQNPDVAMEGLNPLLHFLQHGHAEGRDPHPLIALQWYSERHPEAGSNLQAVEYFIREGDRAGHDPSPLFSGSDYLQLYYDVSRSDSAPFYHYVTFGAAEGRKTKITSRAYNVWDGLNRKLYEGAAPLLRRTMPATAFQSRRRSLMLVAHSATDLLFGAERSFLDVCRGIDLQTYEVTVVLPTGSRNYAREAELLSDRVYTFDYRWWRDANEPDTHVTEAFGALIEKHAVELVYCNTVMLREPLIAARQFGVPSVHHIREILREDPQLLDVIGEEESSVRHQIMERADYLILNSLATESDYLEKPERFIVPNAIDVEDFIGLELPGSDRIYVGMVSSNTASKGLPDFISLAAAARETLPELVFRIIGPETDDLAEILKTQPADSMANIEVIGYQEHPADAISQTHILVNFSSVAESFGRTVVEAMASGRPTIAYAHGAMSEIIEHGETGYLLPYGQPLAALPHLEALLREEGLIHSMGQAGRERSAQMFDLTVLERGMRNVFEQVLEQAAPQTREQLPGTDIPLRIAYFQWFFPVQSETFVLNELRHLVTAGHDVLVFCFDSPPTSFRPDFDIAWERVKSPEELAQRLIATDRQLAHAHFVYPTVTDMLWPACEIAQIPFTCIAHARDIFEYDHEIRNHIVEISQSDLCRRILVPGNFHREFLIERGVAEDMIMINPQGLDTRLYPFTGVEDKPLRGVVSCVQRFVEKKAIKDLIAAGPALAKMGISIRIYGYGPLGERYRDQIADLASDNVELHGPVNSREELIRILSESDLFVTPCIRAQNGDMDGIPTVFMESMAVGTPVVTTAISSIPDLVKDGVNGLVCESNDPQSIADTVGRYFRMPRARQWSMRLAARQHVEAHYETRKLLGRLLDQYRMRTVDIVIVSWNNPKQLKEVIRRIQSYTGMPFRLIINDNASDPETIRYLRELSRNHGHIQVLFQDENLLVGPGTNLALDAGDSEFAIYICGKEGFALQPNWERALVEFMDAHPRVGLGGTLCYSPSYSTGKDYPSIALFDGFRNQNFALENPDRPFFHVQGGLFILRREMYEEIGGFSEAVPHNYTDVEYSHYVESCGWELGAVPGMLALYNKTRPGIFARLDENIGAIHPPTLDELKDVAAIATGEARLCNLCEWRGDAFSEENSYAACPACGALPQHRSAWRYLADSAFTYRQLPALYLNPSKPLASTWQSHFGGITMSSADMLTAIEAEGKLPLEEGALALAFLDNALETGNREILREVSRILSPGATLLVRQDIGQGELTQFKRQSDLEQALDRAGFSHIRTIRYHSQAVQFDWLPLLEYRKAESCAA